jgi:hypothetical protein
VNARRDRKAKTAREQIAAIIDNTSTPSGNAALAWIVRCTASATLSQSMVTC